MKKNKNTEENVQKFFSEIVGRAYKHNIPSTGHCGRMIVPISVKEMSDEEYGIEVQIVDNEGIKSNIMHPESLRFLIQNNRVEEIPMRDVLFRAWNKYIDFLGDCDSVCEDDTFSEEIHNLHEMEMDKLRKMTPYADILDWADVVDSSNLEVADDLIDTMNHNE